MITGGDPKGGVKKGQGGGWWSWPDCKPQNCIAWRPMAKHAKQL